MYCYMLWMVSLSMGTALAQLYCDPVSQYEKDGRCCLMCEPGTSMMATSSCDEPQCKECHENEYQDRHTTARICKRQPYCDPNRNFQFLVNPSKTSRSTCMCQHGFHCSSDECFTCVPHTVCEAGFGAQYKGTHSRDTVCEECPVGTFSNQSSWDSVCGPWTKCEEGYYVVKKGTSASDNECGKSRDHEVIIAIMVLLLGVAIAIGVGSLVYQSKKKRKNLQDCVDTETGRIEQLQVEAKRDEIHTLEENTDDPEPSEDVSLTDKGNVVLQENGKKYILPQQESQTAEFKVEQPLTWGSNLGPSC